MSRASRRPKGRSQPEFDPGELEDLILTPAVGTGIASHLLEPHPTSKADMTTVVGSDGAPEEQGHVTTVNMMLDKTTVVMSEIKDNSQHCQQLIEVPDIGPVAMPQSEVTPVDRTHMTTVVTSALPESASGGVTMPDPGRSVTQDAQTKTIQGTLPIVETSPPEEKIAEGAPQPSTQELWLTENGDPVPPKKVRYVRLAQEALSAAEETVYDILWAIKPGTKDEPAKTVQAGYDLLMKKTRFSRKTIQRIIDKLQYKQFIQIEAPADIYSRAATVYRVHSYRAVLDQLTARGRRYVAKIGPGVVFVHSSRGQGREAATVGESDLTTVDKSAMTTVVNLTPVTGVKLDLTTVVRETTILDNNTERDSSLASSSGCATELRTRLEQEVGPTDDDAARQLLEQCRLRAPDCTVEEILYFVRHKIRLTRSVQNPVGLLLVAIPKHFENNGHAGVRALLHQEELRRRCEEEETRRLWESIAGDPSEPEEARQEARRMLQAAALKGGVQGRRVTL